MFLGDDGIPLEIPTTVKNSEIVFDRRLVIGVEVLKDYNFNLTPRKLQ